MRNSPNNIHEKKSQHVFQISVNSSYDTNESNKLVQPITSSNYGPHITTELDTKQHGRFMVDILHNTEKGWLQHKIASDDKCHGNRLLTNMTVHSKIKARHRQKYNTSHAHGTVNLLFNITLGKARQLMGLQPSL